MATFEQNVKQIREANYGSEVREAIAEGLEQAHQEVPSKFALNMVLSGSVEGGGKWNGVGNMNVSTTPGGGGVLNNTSSVIEEWIEIASCTYTLFGNLSSTLVLHVTPNRNVSNAQRSFGIIQLLVSERTSSGAGYAFWEVMGPGINPFDFVIVRSPNEATKKVKYAFYVRNLESYGGYSFQLINCPNSNEIYSTYWIINDPKNRIIVNEFPEGSTAVSSVCGQLWNTPTAIYVGLVSSTTVKIALWTNASNYYLVLAYNNTKKVCGIYLVLTTGENNTGIITPIVAVSGISITTPSYTEMVIATTAQVYVRVIDFGYLRGYLGQLITTDSANTFRLLNEDEMENDYGYL